MFALTILAGMFSGCTSVVDTRNYVQADGIEMVFDENGNTIINYIGFYKGVGPITTYRLDENGEMILIDEVEKVDHPQTLKYRYSDIHFDSSTNKLVNLYKIGQDQVYDLKVRVGKEGEEWTTHQLMHNYTGTGPFLFNTPGKLWIITSDKEQYYVHELVDHSKMINKKVLFPAYYDRYEWEWIKKMEYEGPDDIEVMFNETLYVFNEEWDLQLQVDEWWRESRYDRAVVDNRTRCIGDGTVMDDEYNVYFQSDNVFTKANISNYKILEKELTAGDMRREYELETLMDRDGNIHLTWLTVEDESEDTDHTVHKLRYMKVDQDGNELIPSTTLYTWKEEGYTFLW